MVGLFEFGVQAFLPGLVSGLDGIGMQCSVTNKAVVDHQTRCLMSHNVYKKLSMQVTIGSSGSTKITARVFNQINWLGDKRKAGRDLLVAVFGREALATSSMTGTATHNPNLGSGAAKPALDPVRLADFVGKGNTA